MGAETGGIGERGRLARRGCGRPAPRGRRCARALSHVRRPASTRSSMPRSRSHSACGSSATSVNPAARAACRSCSRTTSAVMSCVARRVERRRAPPVGPVRAQPVVGAAFEDPADVVDVVDRDQRAAPEHAAAGREPRVDAARDRKPGTGRHREPVGDRVERIGVGRLRPARAPRRTRRSARARPAPRPAARRRTPRSRTAGCRAARWRARRPVSSSAGSSSSATNTGPVPDDRGRRVVRRLAARTGRAPRRPARARAARAARRAARPTARRARSAARAGTSGAARSTSRASRPLPGAGLDDDERIGLAERVPAPVERARHARAEQRADLGARDEVAAGAARAVTRREEADLGLVERDLDEPVERDRALAADEARDRVGRRTALERPLPDPREELRVDADHDDDRAHQRDRAGERRRNPDRRCGRPRPARANHILRTTAK